MDLAVGYFPYKYNPEARNLGEYLFRSGTYPVYLTNDYDFPLARVAGLRYGLNFSNDLLGIHSPEGPICRAGAPFEHMPPLIFRNEAVLVVPKWLKDVAIIDQQPDRFRKLVPYHLVQQLIVIGVDKSV